MTLKLPQVPRLCLEIKTSSGTVITIPMLCTPLAVSKADFMGHGHVVDMKFHGMCEVDPCLRE